MPGNHLLQTWEWGELKSRFGWEPVQKAWHDEQENPIAAALVLKRSIKPGGISTGLSMLYVPRGPLLDWTDKALVSRILSELEDLARKEKAIVIKMDPELVIGRGIPGEAGSQESEIGLQALQQLRSRGWFYSNEQVQFRNTVWIDLTSDLDDLLSQMKQKTRYNIRLADRKGVKILPANSHDYDRLYRMYAETSVRDGFVIRSRDYYTTLWSLFQTNGMLDILTAKVEEEIVAALFLFHFDSKAWYLYGMSTSAHRDKMPNHLLQWEAIKLAKKLGCSRYDLWGAPEVFDESDDLWGVYRFKEGFNGEVVRTLGAWDFTPRKYLYNMYARALPALLSIMRRRGRRSTQQDL